MNKNYEKLIECGFQASHAGTKYLLEAMELYAPGCFLTKELYPAIAARHQVSPAAVERCIRHAIATAAKKGAGDFHDTIVGKYCDRSIGEVLARLYFAEKWGDWDEN